MVPVIDPAWWTSGVFQGHPMPEILARRDFGAVFAFLRQRGWSIGAIARVTQVDEHPIREIIKGNRQVTAYEVIERIVCGLGIDRHLCGIGVAPQPEAEADRSHDSGLIELTDWLERARAVDDQAIAALTEQTNQIRRIDRVLGAQAADLQLRGHLTTLRQLRSFSLSPARRERLADEFCDAAALAGWVALDLGDVARAWRHHEAAKDAGRETGSVVALAHALAQQAYVLVEIGQIAEARQLADHAVSVGGGAVPPVLAAWLHAVVGEIAAISGDAARSGRSFEVAASLLPADCVDPAVPYIMLDEYQLARWRGTACARLGDQAAITDLYHALTGMDATFIRARAQLHVDLAHSLIAAHQEDEALRQMRLASQFAVRVGSSRQRRRVRQLELLLDHPRGQYPE